MATFSFEKDVNDVAEPIAIAEGWYKARVTKEPEVKPNKKATEGLSYEEGAGKNMVINLMLAENSDDEVNGRTYTIWLPFPLEQDMGVLDNRGMDKYDAKMARITQFAEAAVGAVADGQDVDINQGAMVGVYVNKGINQQSQQIENNVNAFNGFKDPEEI